MGTRTHACSGIHAAMSAMEGRSKPEMHKQPPEILAVLFHAMVERLDVGALQEPQHRLLQLAASLARDDLNHRNPVPDGILHRAVQRRLDVPAPVENIMKIHLDLGQTTPSPYGSRGIS